MDRDHLLKEMVSGSVGMATVSALLNPFDVVKLRMQTHPSCYSTMLDCASKSIMGSGGVVKGLLIPGMTATILRDILNGAFRVGMYKEVERALFPNPSHVPVLVRKIVTGCLVGSLGAGLWSHTDLVKNRMQTLPPNSKISTLSCYRSLVSRHGLVGLYRGVGPNMLRASIITTCHVGTYDSAKQYIIRNANIPQDSVLLWTMCGFMSALVTTTVSAPVDLVRNKIMVSNSPTSAFTMSRTIYRTDGVRGLFRGWLPSFYRFGPHFTLSWPLIELARTRIFDLDPF